MIDELETKDIQGLRLIAEAVHKARFRDRFEEVVQEAVDALDIAEEEARTRAFGDKADRAYDEKRDNELLEAWEKHNA